ncbi:aspartyl protease family protein 2-like [Papaver somniferum]|uniref:aspartyl protease family protein 2-like n=1 Tax=Papaver somniferum TaxID=3469 RepID=UPI000E6F82FA|nr:aspartyl protease family protein 2-like [Papaver somniferum]
MSFETFSMSQNDGITQSEQEILNVPLGCATKTQRFWYMDGLLALGMGRFSFYSFLKDNYGVTMFSYCLLDQINEREDQSDMLFGEQVVSNLTQFTPMIRDYYSNEHYAVSLSRIQVEGEALDSYMFPIKMVVDTGSLITDLPSPVYNVLERKFLGVANELAWGRAINISDNYPCYIIDPDQISASSTITFTFQKDAKLILRPHNIWRYIDEDGAACFAFADASEASDLKINILGNIQQQGLRVIIDQTTEDRIGFDPLGC